MLRVESGSCTRYYSKLSGCKKCEEVCPTKAIESFEGGLKAFNEKCIDCGACIGVCPTEALRLDNLDLPTFFFEFIKSDEVAISCKKNFVCLAGLNVEYLIALKLVKEFVLDIGHCEECEIKEQCFPIIERNFNEANYVLSALGKKEITAEKLKLVKDENVSRREFFNIFKGLTTKKEEHNPIAKMKEKSLPDKRKVLLTVLNKVEKPQEYKLLENEHLTFISDKEIDHTCDNCSLCYRICPTQALSTTSRGDKILFEPILCLRCELCHDVCEKDSIHLTPYFDTKEFFEPSQKVLAQFQLVRCEECGNLFTYLGDQDEELLCPRCRIEEEEAKKLWGLG